MLNHFRHDALLQRTARTLASRALALLCLTTAFGTNAQAQTAYYDGLISSLSTQYGTPSSGTYMIGGNENTVMTTPSVSTWSPNGFASYSLNQVVSDSPTNFTRKLVATQMAKSTAQFPRADGEDTFSFRTPQSANGYSNGDHLLLVFWAKGSNYRSNGAASNYGMITAGIMGNNGGTWFGNRMARINGSWQRFFLYVRATSGGSSSDVNPLRVQFSTSKMHQTVEVAGVALINYRTNSANLFNLSNSGYNYESYVGKTSAGSEGYQSEIDANRKVNLNLTVKNSSGATLSGANVHIKQKKHGFLFGGSEDAYYLLDQNWGAAHQQSILDVNMNGVYDDAWSAVTDWSMTGSTKAAGYTDGNYTELDNAINWYQSKGLKIFLHTLAWGDATSFPGGIAQNTVSIRNHINNVTRRYKGKIYGYHVLNETFARRTWENSFSSYDAWVTEVAEWFKIARTNDPGAKLYLSDNNILEGAGWNENRISFYEKLVRDLRAKGAQVDGFAFQAHFGNDGDHYFNDIPRLKAILDRFGALNLKCRISEFDFFNYASDAQRANYLRDFVTVCFANPHVDSIMFWDRDGAGWINDPYGVGSGLLYDANWRFRAPGQAWWNLVYSKYWSNITKTSASDGTASARVFRGDYEVTVTPQGGSAQTFWLGSVSSDSTFTLTMNGSVSGGSGGTTGTGNGVWADYYNDTALTNLSLWHMEESTINRNFRTGSYVSGQPVDNFSVMWSGKIQAQESGTYTLTTETDDGVRLYIDLNNNGTIESNELVINKWQNQGATQWSANVSLSAGTKYKFRMDYFEAGGSAIAKLLWTRPGQTSKVVVPQSQLYRE